MASNDSSASAGMQPSGRDSSSGQSYLSHQRQSALANNAQKQATNGMMGGGGTAQAQASSGQTRYSQYQGVFSSSGGGADQQSLQPHGMPFLSGSGEQEDQLSSSQQFQYGVGGSAASAAGGGSAANEAAIGGAHSMHQQMMGSGGQSSAATASASQQQTAPHNNQQETSASSQQMLMQGSSQSTGMAQSQAQQQPSQQPSSQQPTQSAPPSSASLQQPPPGTESQEDRKTDGGNTPSKDGADTPLYRDQQNQMPHIAQLYNLTSRKLQVIQEERARASSATRDGANSANASSNVDV